MSIQSLMQSGSDSASNLEKIADAFLYIPSLLWLSSRSVKVIEKEGKMELLDRGFFDEELLYQSTYSYREKMQILDPITNHSYGHFTMMCLAPLLASPALIAYIAATIFSVPLLAIGAILKKISLLNAEKAEVYNQLAYQASITHELAIEKFQNVIKKSNVKDEINKLDISNLPPEPAEIRTKRDRKVYVLRKETFKENKRLQKKKLNLEMRIAQLGRKLDAKQHLIQQLFDKYIKLSI